VLGNYLVQLVKLANFSTKLETSLIYGIEIEIGFKKISSSKIKIEVFFNFIFWGENRYGT
jgi:hypothetical protein